MRSTVYDKQTTNKFSPEVRARAVRMVAEHEAERPSRWAAMGLRLEAEPPFHVADDGGASWSYLLSRIASVASNPAMRPLTLDQNLQHLAMAAPEGERLFGFVKGEHLRN